MSEQPGIIVDSKKFPALNTKKLKKGQVLFREGDYGKNVYLILSGELRVYQGRGVSEVELATLKERQLFGEMGFLGDGKRMASVEATEPTELIELDLSKYKEFMSEQPRWLTILIESLLSHLKRANEKIIQV